MELVILAAGMGSRFGGLKQMEPVGQNGEFIIDYSIFDSKRCGFEKVVFIIKEENYDAFRDTIGKRIENKIKVEYVFQKNDDLPFGFFLPQGREKPWGTAHALLCCKNIVKNDFLIINGDDFYGFNAFKVGAEYIKNRKKPNFLQKLLGKKTEYGLVTYEVKNTLTDNGSAKRGVCKISNDNLTAIDECVIEKKDGKYIANPLDTDRFYEIPENCLVSMNMWCFTPEIFDYLEKAFPVFLNKNIEKNPLKCEFLLPMVVDEMIKKNKCKVKVISTTARWCGITYREDAPIVKKTIKEITDQGVYPTKLWE